MSRFLPVVPATQSNRWVRPLLAFVITFGVLAMAATVVRTVVLYRRLISQGTMPDNPDAVNEVTRELSRMDQTYTPAFLIAAVLIAAVAAVVFARWRPKGKADLPPPLPSDR